MKEFIEELFAEKWLFSVRFFVGFSEEGPEKAAGFRIRKSL